ncbi:DUF3014 domain-containing protein [Acidovorax sp. NCPPB 2350]|nr:DUF3014 domain-containing protein [Acidovorax sp. NCPPB 2350]
MPDRDLLDFRPPSSIRSRASPLPWVAAGTAVLAAAGAAWWFGWLPPREQAPPPPVAQAPSSRAPAAPPATVAWPQHPVAPPEDDSAALPSLDGSDAVFEHALAEWLGARSVADRLRMDSFVRRIVVTVDNLPRAQAPSRLWPVQPVPGHFLVQADAAASREEALDDSGEGGAPLQAAIAPANAARYEALVVLAEAVPRDRAVALYRQFYPLFQQAYMDLGYPKGYFNDRLVAVLGHLLQTPEPAGPLRVRLTRVQGAVPSTRPWVRYEFADPHLQALSSGQKAMLRLGPENARRLKVVLADLRRRIATGEQPARAASGAAPGASAGMAHAPAP